jgi:hypothetical protein
MNSPFAHLAELIFDFVFEVLSYAPSWMARFIALGCVAIGLVAVLSAELHLFGGLLIGLGGFVLVLEWIQDRT